MDSYCERKSIALGVPSIVGPGYRNRRRAGEEVNRGNIYTVWAMSKHYKR